ncbi:MAG: LysR family transcriptional regulator [Lachnospiraceae bacterium]|nr:LysR family transcriptional regulator [Lachnospiraceae bacterium]
MNLKSLAYFVTVAEELNISRAAEKLNMSQPPLSAQIKNLEYDLKTELFIRGKRQLTLTEAGQLLYKRAKEIINIADRAEEEILSMSGGLTGTISLGLVEGMAPDIVADWFSGFIKKYPKATFRITDGNTDDILEKLLSGIINLAVITAPYNQALLHSVTVSKEGLCVLMNKNHPLAKSKKDTVNIADIAKEPLIVPRRKAMIDNIYRWYRDIHKEPHIVCEIDSYLDAVALSSRGVGISIFPKSAYIPNDKLIAKDLTGNIQDIEYLFVWRKGHPLPTLESTFVDYIIDAFR